MNKFIIIIFFILFSTKISAQSNFDVQFFSDTFLLSGTLTIPSGTNENWPVIIFVHGSGPNDRLQTTPIAGGNANCLYPDLVGDTVRNFLDLSEFLAMNGYATFRFDKRSFTYGNTIDQTTITLYDFMRDVESAIDYVKTRIEIDTTCITLLGHSQGGSMIPYIAKGRSDISKLIALATPSTPVDTLISIQLRDLYYVCLNDSATGNSIYNQSIAIYNQIRNNTWPSNTAVNGAYPTFWRSWIDVSDSTIYNFNTADLPTLLTFGINDFNVPISDMQDFSNQLSNDYHIEQFEDLNHFLTDSTSAQVKSELMTEILNWLTTVQCDTSTGLIENKIQLALNDYREYFEINLPYSQKLTINIYNILGELIQQIDSHEKLLRVNKNENKSVHFIKVVDSEFKVTSFKLMF
jgi:hypothetical protein